MQRAARRFRRFAYRVGQFFSVLLAALAPLAPEELAEARSRLPDAAWPLFLAMGRADQRHSLRVLRRLDERSPCPPPLAQAALLHDCAKGPGRVRLWHRVAAVLLKDFAPGTYQAWRDAAAPAPEGWRYPLWTHLHHPQLGAQMAAAAGCDPRAALMIERHQEPGPAGTGDPEADEWLAALRAVDDDN